MNFPIHSNLAYASIQCILQLAVCTEDIPELDKRQSTHVPNGSFQLLLFQVLSFCHAVRLAGKNSTKPPLTLLETLVLFLLWQVRMSARKRPTNGRWVHLLFLHKTSRYNVGQQTHWVDCRRHIQIIGVSCKTFVWWVDKGLSRVSLKKDTYMHMEMVSLTIMVLLFHTDHQEISF